jgi:hypothetical protein
MGFATWSNENLSRASQDRYDSIQPYVYLWFRTVATLSSHFVRRLH